MKGSGTKELEQLRHLRFKMQSLRSKLSNISDKSTGQIRSI